MDEGEAPQVFMCHTSGDKPIVGKLAEQLISKGVDVWYDDWEIGPGDSFVQKIEEGLSGCDVFVIVISENSVGSKWVGEELSSAIVRRIEGQARIIPVRLDDTPVPTVINHLHWVKMRPFEEGLEKLLKGVFGIYEKPPRGEVPEFIRKGLQRRKRTVSGLSPEAFAALEHMVLEVGLDRSVSAKDLAALLDVDPVEVNDAVDELESGGLAQPIKVMGTHPYSFLGVRPKPGAWLYIDPARLGFDPWKDMLVVAQCVVGHGKVDVRVLEHDTGLSPERINLAALNLERQGLVKLLKSTGTAPYRFFQAWATRRTRQWVREQQGE